MANTGLQQNLWDHVESYMKLFEIAYTPKQQAELDAILDNHPKRGQGRTVKKDNVAEYIYNPSIIDIEPGNMVRVHIDRPPVHKNFSTYQGQRDWGTLVLNVDYKKEMVLVGDCVGGTKQFSEWVPLSNIKVTWNIGGYEAAMKKLNSFNGAVQDTLDKQEDALQQADQAQAINKYVKRQ